MRRRHSRLPSPTCPSPLLLRCAVLQEAEAGPHADGAMDEAGDGPAEEGERLPSWHAVPLDGRVPPVRARAPHGPAGSADAGCLQLEGGLCATGTTGGFVHLWSTAGDVPQHARGLPGHVGGVTTLSFQRQTGWLVAGTGGGSVAVWSLERCGGCVWVWGECTASMQGGTKQPRCVAFPALPRIHRSGAKLHDLVPPQTRSPVMCHQQSGPLLAVGSAGHSVHVWDLRAPSVPRHSVPLGSLPYCLQVRRRKGHVMFCCAPAGAPG